ncbi:MAG TPA: Hsp20/alpha crystallin family protein [Vicinamibacterales bacterium]|nr:Hsp20/alpha crystallin family protein [Vicinamibacterales bacterium]
MTLTRWSPVRDLAAVEIERLNRMFEAAFSGEALATATWVPAIDVYETAENDVIVKVDLPDVKRDDIKVTFENSVLTIEGERKFVTDASREKYHRMERGYGAFRRSLTLPATVDAARVEAGYQDGLLTVKLPRREESRPRQIQVNG